MKRATESFLKVVFEIIVVLILVILVAVFILGLVGISTGEQPKYIKFAKELASNIDNGKGTVVITSYDPDFIYIIETNGSGLYLDLYRCQTGFTSGEVQYGISVLYYDQQKGIFYIGPDLSTCVRVFHQKLNKNRIKIYINGTPFSSGYLCVPRGEGDCKMTYYFGTPVIISSTSNIFKSMVYLSNPTLGVTAGVNITCDSTNGCTFDYPSTDKNAICKNGGSVISCPMGSCAYLYGFFPGANVFQYNTGQNAYVYCAELGVDLLILKCTIGYSCTGVLNRIVTGQTIKFTVDGDNLYVNILYPISPGTQT
ncbi:MAG: hypothetical protein ACP5G1_02370 [Nanopusillaceae archaeon]